MLRVAFTVSSAAPPRSVMPSAGQSTMLHTRPIPAPGALSMSWKQSPPRTSDGSANGHASAVCELHARTHLPDRSWLSKPPGVPPIATSSSSSSSTFCRLSALCFCATAAASRRLQSLRRCSVCSLLLRPVPLTRPPSHCPSPPASPARGKFLSEAPSMLTTPRDCVRIGHMPGLLLEGCSALHWVPSCGVAAFDRKATAISADPINQSNV